MVDPSPIRFLRNLGRMRQIVSVLLNHGFGDLIEQLHLGPYLRWGQRVILRREVASPLSRAQRIRLALESLGPTFIKFGQVLSTRPDLVPADVVEELKRLREHVPPFDSRVAKEIVERELGPVIGTSFIEFDEHPLAAGSLAQVHRARHQNGMPLAIKILRPGIGLDIERDLALMTELATLVQRYIPEADVFDPLGLVQHFARSIRREVNLLREGRTLLQFRRLFRTDASLKVPLVYEDLTTPAVLTQEFIEGWRIDCPDDLLRNGINPEAVAANGARIFLKQAFEFGVFHGDPHPGNIRVVTDGSLCLLDYGMIGVLDDQLRDQLVSLLQAVARRDVTTAVRVIQSFNRFHTELDVPVLRVDVRDFIETYYGLRLEELNVGQMLQDFIRIVASHGIKCPGDLLLLIRAMITLEGVGKTLSPTFSIAEVLQPTIEQLIRQRYSPKRLASRIIEETSSLLDACAMIPGAASRTLDKISKDQLRIQFEMKRIDRLITEIDRSSNRVVISLILAALIVASALILRSANDSYWLSVPVYVLSSLLGAWLIWGIFRSGRL